MLTRRGLGQLGDRLFIVAALVLVAVVWWPLLANYFYSDDFALLYDAVNRPLGPFLIDVQGGHLYVVRNLVALATFVAFGANPVAWFAVVLATHVLNVALLAGVLRRIAGSAAIGAAAAAVWGIAPVQEGTLGWYSVYGQVLATTGLLVLLSEIDRAGATGGITNGRLAWWYVLALLETNLFGTGIAVALVLPVVAALALPAACRWRAAAVLAGLWVVVPALYATQLWLWARFGDGGPGRLALYIGLASYVGRDLTMLVALFRRGIASIVLGVFAAPSTVDATAGTVAVIAYAIAVAAMLFAGDGLVRRRVLALGAVAAAAYGMIAVGRATFITALPAATAAAFDTTRYHYLASAPLAGIAAVCVATVLARIPKAAALRGAVGAAILGALAVGAARSDRAIDHHAAARHETEEALAHIADAVAQEPPGHFVRIPNRRFESVGILYPPTRFHGLAAVFAIFHRGDEVDGRTVRFVAVNADVRASARTGRRSATLLVPP